MAANSGEGCKCLDCMAELNLPTERNRKTALKEALEVVCDIAEGSEKPQNFYTAIKLVRELHDSM